MFDLKINSSHRHCLLAIFQCLWDQSTPQMAQQRTPSPVAVPRPLPAPDRRVQFRAIKHLCKACEDARAPGR